jgi:hypothetical protein|tara:strand:- start:169 stop:423 length:255 start_codon:yes stop_codon:yes gene_type:complete
MSEKIKLSKEELEQLKSFQIRNNDITFRLGQVDIQKAIIEGQRSDLLDKLANLQEESNKVGKELQEKYGEGNIDLDAGEITPVK